MVDEEAVEEVAEEVEDVEVAAAVDEEDLAVDEEDLAVDEGDLVEDVVGAAAEDTLLVAEEEAVAGKDSLIFVSFLNNDYLQIYYKYLINSLSIFFIHYTYLQRNYINCILFCFYSSNQKFL